MPYENRMDNLLQGFSLVALLFIYNVGLVIKVGARRLIQQNRPPLTSLRCSNWRRCKTASLV
jgi:hypothetical protein